MDTPQLSATILRRDRVYDGLHTSCSRSSASSPVLRCSWPTTGLQVIAYAVATRRCGFWYRMAFSAVRQDLIRKVARGGWV